MPRRSRTTKYSRRRPAKHRSKKSYKKRMSGGAFAGLGSLKNTINARQVFRNRVCKDSLDDAKKALQGYSYYAGIGYTSKEQDDAYNQLKAMRDNFMFTNSSGQQTNFCGKYNPETNGSF